MPNRRIPLWLMGLTNLTYGLYGGVVAFAIPQVLGNRNVAESTIAGITAVALTPGFWAFVFSPILDVRFSRRSYCVLLACFTAASVVVVFQSLNHLVLLQFVLTAGFFAAYLYQSSLGGWLSTIATPDEEKTLSVWITVANIGGFGIMSIGGAQIVERLSPLSAALVLGFSILLPMVGFLFMPAPGPDRRLASESFTRFFGDLIAIVKRRQVLVALILFAAPGATFSLTNFLAARGNDFHASAAFVGLIGAVGGTVGGIAGCFLFPPLSRLMPLRPLYLSIGITGACVTLSLTLLPHVPAAFAIALIAENLFQSCAITTSTAIIFDTIGKNNPLASTTFCFVGSAFSLPISYMLYVESFGYTHGGIAGSFIVDAVAGILACVLLGTMLFWLGRKSPAPPAIPADTR
ncbi:MAG TPA: MFS transporter [Terracidiphilus sp.]|nr:MFS transporter [Terracidiphilus sp.]